jgi:tRNA uridine 5-carbamoylmethylation protein Kti12
MPLVVVVGIPTSGKTTRTQELKTYFEEEHKAEVIVVSEDSLEMSKRDFYADPQ